MPVTVGVIKPTLRTNRNTYVPAFCIVTELLAKVIPYDVNEELNKTCCGATVETTPVEKSPKYP
jgi:hypothetical protein